ncbi:hypothetical protein LTR53_009043 [Teratosphaeriaceae sp. CCFEE 6253]|nr:hypothetical protein LTR53_009043 [Teratosphaeriaceae sp. CCFEE 6253]
MDTNARYSALEHGGLEVRDVAEGPEVVPGSSPPLERRSSLNMPETVHPAQYETNNQEHGNFYGDGKTEAHAPTYAEKSRPAYMSNEAKGPSVAALETQAPRKPRRYCGMGKGVLVALIVVLVVVVIGAVLGGVLGALLSRHHKSSKSPSPLPSYYNTTNTTTPSDSPLPAMVHTGFATAIASDGSGRLLMYYQDPEGRVIENAYLGGSWTLQDESLVNQSVVTMDATPGSPLAALSYTQGSLQYRQVFYLDASGLVKTTNSTTVDTNAIATSWSVPYAITTDPASTSGTAGLAACSDDLGMNGIRVYYGSGNGYIQEVAYQFNHTANGWNEQYSFVSSDPNSGVACVVFENPAEEDEYLNVYMRNSSGTVAQNCETTVQFDRVTRKDTDNGAGWNFYTNDGWTLGPETSTNYSIASGTPIAVCNDEQQSEYVHFQLQNGTIVRGLVDPSGSYFEQYDLLQPATSNSKLASTFVDGGALLLFQNDTSASTMWVADTSRTLVSILNEAIP